MAPKNKHGRLYEPVCHPVRQDLFKLILNLPQKELQRHKKYIGNRYVRQFLSYAPYAYFKSKTKKINHLRDKDISDCYAFSAFGKKLRALLPKEKELWKDYLPATLAPDRYYTVKYHFPEDATPYEGCYVANSSAIFRKVSTKKFELLGIQVDGEQFSPIDGKHWMLAKHFLMNAAFVFLLAIDHPQMHLPMDAIIGHTMRVLPQTHLIHQLLAPHFNFTAAVNKSVMTSPSSPINSEAERAFHSSPLSFTGNLSMISASRHGLDASGYNSFIFEPSFDYFPTNYYKFLKKYYDVILDYVKQIFAAANFKTDVFTREWAKAIHKDLEGFDPQIVETQLPELIAKIIHNSSVAHSDDHKTIGDLPHHKICSRISVPPPKRGKEPYKRLSDIRSKHNYFRQLMSNKLFYQPYTLDCMLDVQYPFDTPALQEIAKQFVVNLQAAEQALQAEGVTIYQKLSEMSPSIQF